MNTLDQLTQLIATIERKKFFLYLQVLIGFLVLSCAGILYFLYNTRAGQIKTLEQLHEQVQKIDVIMKNYDRMSTEEQRIKNLLEDHKDFSLKTYFEQFCKEHNITADSGWNTEVRSIDGNDAFDEIILPAVFKNQTTQTLITILTSLNTNEIVYIKELEIKNEQKKSIQFNITIATKKRKQFWED